MGPRKITKDENNQMIKDLNLNKKTRITNKPNRI